MSTGEQVDGSIGLGLLTFAPAELDEFVEAGRFAERLGYQCAYTTESLTDTLAIDEAIALGTSRLQVGSFVALSYLRHPIIAAQGAATIQDLSGGRFTLGIGLGHRVRNEALGIEAGAPSTDLSDYVTSVRAVLEGRGRERYPELPPQVYQGETLEFRVPKHPVPILTAAVGPRMARVGGSVADGLMLYMQPRHGLEEIRREACAGAEEAGRDPSALELHLGMHAFVADDHELALEKARGSLAYWVGLSAYNQRIAATGFEDEARELKEAFQRDDMDGLTARIPDELVRQFCLVGTPDECREQLRGFYDQGVDLVAIMPDPVAPGETYPAAVKRTLEALQP